AGSRSSGSRCAGRGPGPAARHASCPGAGGADPGRRSGDTGAGRTPPHRLEPGGGNAMDGSPARAGDGDPLWVRVEIPSGSRNKYEYDEAARELRLDRTLHSSVHYPTDYGYLPGTRTLAGDELDVLVLTWEPAVPGC